eukprot:TRINITY_DN1459_c0_g1_i1.p3 TRINITY_DN1459_c0_g1~~TRINITY_DN1459_c0_g1_i1.p3  ORF type:complete len:456 (+),score=81.98 TRINITY_DN1459_c0_g1_i1:4983-6350(+)
MKSNTNKIAVLENEISTINGKMQRAKAKYISSLKEAEETLYDCEGVRLNPTEYMKVDPQIQEKLNVKMWSALRNLEEDYESYKGYGKFSANFQSQYETILKQILDELQNQEEQRIQTTKESLQKLLIYEVSMEQNHRYDIKQINDTIEGINCENDIQEIITKEPSNVNKFARTLPRLLQLESCKSDWNRLFEFYREKYYGKEDFMDYARVVEETKEYIIRAGDKEYKTSLANFQKLVQKILVSRTAVEPALLESCKKLLISKKSRQAFIDALQEGIEMGKSKLTQDGYKAIAHLMLCFLDKVFQYNITRMQGYQGNEVEQIAKTIKISETLHWSDDNKNKESLLFAVKSHEVWKDTGFWQKLFKENAELELRLKRSRLIKEKQQGVQNSPKTQREKSVAGDKLMVYAFQMMKLGLDPEDIQGFADRNAKLYEISPKSFDNINVRERYSRQPTIRK